MVIRQGLATNSLERTFAILDLVSAKPSGITLSGIMRRLGLPASSCHYILTRLERHGYLFRIGDTKRYVIGVRLIAVAHSALRDVGVRSAAEPALHRLAMETRSGAFVGVLERNAVMIVGKVEEPGLLKMDMEIGVRYPAHLTALGKVLLADLRPSEFRRSFLPYIPLKDRTGRPLRQLLKELGDVKVKGHGTNNEELFIGIRAIAAPIIDSDGRVRSAVSATGPRFHIDDEAVIRAVKSAAREISMRRSAKL
jgi:DNA-binding IclR family transcriptional regulator